MGQLIDTTLDAQPRKKYMTHVTHHDGPDFGEYLSFTHDFRRVIERWGFTGSAEAARYGWVCHSR